MASSIERAAVYAAIEDGIRMDTKKNNIGSSPSITSKQNEKSHPLGNDNDSLALLSPRSIEQTNAAIDILNVIKNQENDAPAPPVRRGKWTAEEEAYATRLIEDFKLGLLPLADGTTLRTFLSKLLNCEPMRISKKFVGVNCIGKQVFTSFLKDFSPVDIEKRKIELQELEKRFLDRIENDRGGAATIIDVPRGRVTPSAPPASAEGKAIISGDSDDGSNIVPPDINKKINVWGKSTMPMQYGIMSTEPYAPVPLHVNHLLAQAMEMPVLPTGMQSNLFSLSMPITARMGHPMFPRTSMSSHFALLHRPPYASFPSTFVPLPVPQNHFSGGSNSTDDDGYYNDNEDDEDGSSAENGGIEVNGHRKRSSGKSQHGSNRQDRKRSRLSPESDSVSSQEPGFQKGKKVTNKGTIESVPVGVENGATAAATLRYSTARYLPYPLSQPLLSMAVPTFSRPRYGHPMSIASPYLMGMGAPIPGMGIFFKNVHSFGHMTTQPDASMVPQTN